MPPAIRQNAAEQAAEEERARLQGGNITRIAADEIRRDPHDGDHVELGSGRRQHLAGPQERNRALGQRL